MATLGSQWGGENYGLNKHLIAKIYPVDKNGKPENPSTDNTVLAPLTDGNIDVSLNWNSAFENTGTDAKYSSISQLIQSGQASTLFALLADFIPKEAQGIIGDARNTLEALGNEAKNLEGQTGITKLNSRQVFSGLPPIKIPITMYFRAWANAQDEVESPINQLFEWALPQELADESAVVNVIRDVQAGNTRKAFNDVFPSKIPKFVALEYGGRTYTPLVIESIAHPLVLPRSKDGEMLSASVQLTLATLTAWGKDDYARSLSIKSDAGLDVFLRDSGF